MNKACRDFLILDAGTSIASRYARYTSRESWVRHIFLYWLNRRGSPNACAISRAMASARSLGVEWSFELLMVVFVYVDLFSLGPVFPGELNQTDRSTEPLQGIE